MHEYILLTNIGELECYEEAIEDDHRGKWIEAIQDKIRSLHENYTFKLVKLPKARKALKNKSVFRTKNKEHSSRPWYKA